MNANVAARISQEVRDLELYIASACRDLQSTVHDRVQRIQQLCSDASIPRESALQSEIARLSGSLATNQLLSAARGDPVIIPRTPPAPPQQTNIVSPRAISPTAWSQSFTSETDPRPAFPSPPRSAVSPSSPLPTPTALSPSQEARPSLSSWSAAGPLSVSTCFRRTLKGAMKPPWEWLGALTLPESLVSDALQRLGISPPAPPGGGSGGAAGVPPKWFGVDLALTRPANGVICGVFSLFDADGVSSDGYSGPTPSGAAARCPRSGLPPHELESLLFAVGTAVMGEASLTTLSGRAVSFSSIAIVRIWFTNGPVQPPAVPPELDVFMGGIFAEMDRQSKSSPAAADLRVVYLNYPANHEEIRRKDSSADWKRLDEPFQRAKIDGVEHIDQVIFVYDGTFP